MSPDARMRLESVSKIWTAVLIHQLASEASLTLTETVEDWFPGALPDGDRITIAHLLTHTSGLIDTNDVYRDPEPYLARVADPELSARLRALARRLERNPATEFSPRLWVRLAAYQPLLFEPGTQSHYSNIGFQLLGLIASRTTGATLPTLFHDHVFAPLGLERTAYDPQGPIAGEHARGYNAGAGGELTDATAAHAGIGAEGGIVSTAAETARFLTALMRGELLSEPELTQMRTSTFWGGGELTGCGLAFGHSGGGSGYKTNALVSGDGTRVAVLLLNARGDSAADARAGALLTRLFCATEARQ
jgi:D-alanyl-D-alanine carboxypeptidase